MEYPLNRLKQQPPFSCDKCAKSNWLSKGAEANKKLHVNGTNLAAIASRKNGSVNKNNSSGVNGVCRGKSGKWRAYIVLRGKQYYLGNFSELDDAIAARKNAEKKFFDPEIIKFVDQNPKTWKKAIKKQISSPIIAMTKSKRQNIAIFKSGAVPLGSILKVLCKPPKLM